MVVQLNNDEDVLKFTGDVPFTSIQDAAKFVENYTAYNDVGYGRWIIESKEDGEVHGWCGLKYHPNENYTDLGYRINKACWGKGIATEAAQACLAAAREVFKLKEVIGRTSKHNIASIKVLEKCGMQLWKIDKCEGIENALYYRALFD